MTESAARNAPHAKPLFHLARLAALALLMPLVAQAETITTASPSATSTITSATS